MERCWQTLLLLWLTAVLEMGNTAKAVGEDGPLVRNFTHQFLKIIPPNDNNCNVTKLVIKWNQITLNKKDQLALASYPTLRELHLEGNQITAIPANCFSGVPHLKVLSLARNNISSLDPQAFSGLDVLIELDLSFNLLTSLPEQLVKGLIEPQMLNLQENPWNCSCPLLSTIGEIYATHGNIGGPKVICASPAKQAGTTLLEATVLCSTTPIPTITTNRPEQPTSAHSQQPSTVLKTTLSSSQNHGPGKGAGKGRRFGRWNAWMFTACVAIFALATSMVILCGIKGPSWFKIFHNYRHRRLYPEDEGEDEVSTVFTEDLGGDPNHQTFTFEQHNRQMEKEDGEEEDGYFEDPYIRRD